jgi:hypothetical protein
MGNPENPEGTLVPGPPPKPPALRRRRNRRAGEGTITTIDPAGEHRPIPPLPRRRWHEQTRAWWKTLWRSPIAAQFIAVDIPALHVVALLRDGLWRGQLELAGELRLQEARFGLTPLDRRRLGWEVKAEPEQEQEQTEPPQESAVMKDPRLLRFVTTEKGN